MDENTVLLIFLLSGSLIVIGELIAMNLDRCGKLDKIGAWCIGAGSGFIAWFTMGLVCSTFFD